MATLDSNKVTGVGNVSDPNDAANKYYVDNKAAQNLYPTPALSDSNKFLGVGVEKWTARTSGLSSEYVLDATYGPGKTDPYAVVSTTTLITSTDTISWRKRTTGFASASVYQRTVSHGYVFVLGGYTYSSSAWRGALMTSTDGIGWTHRTTPFSDASNRIYRVRYLNNLYLAVGGYNFNSGAAHVAVSTDAIVWVARTTGAPSFTYPTTSYYPVFYTVDYASGVYIAAGFPDTYLITSTDTIHWQTRTTGLSVTTSSGNAFMGSAASSSISESYVLAQEYDGIIISSTDSIVWTFRTSGTGSTGFHNTGITYNNKYIFSGGGEDNTYGYINISSDAIHWTVKQAPGAIDFFTGITDTEEDGRILVSSYSTRNSIHLFDFSGRKWEYAKGTQEYTTPGSYTFNIPSKANQLYVEIIGAGGGGSGGSTSIGGRGGGGGAYITGIIRRSELQGNSSLNITVGSGGAGGSASNGAGANGGYSQINFGSFNWKAGGGTRAADFLFPAGGQVDGASNTNSFGFISVEGGSGAVNPGSYIDGPGISTSPSLPNQITGGAAGGYNDIGGSVTSYYYGNTHISIGGTSGSVDGQVGLSKSFTGSYGSGGGGGGGTNGKGGNGTVGGGGGGGGCSTNDSGAAGRGGNGYVKIIWW